LDTLTIRAIMLALASYLDGRKLADGNWVVFPSEALLSEQVERSSRTIRRVLRYLQDNGLIKCVHAAVWPGRNRPGRPAMYLLLLNVWQDHPRRVLKRPSKNESSNGLDTNDVPINGLATDSGPNAVNRMGVSPVSNGLAMNDRPKAMGWTPATAPRPMGWSPVATEPDQGINRTIKTRTGPKEPDQSRVPAREGIPPGPIGDEKKTTEDGGECCRMWTLSDGRGHHPSCKTRATVVDSQSLPVVLPGPAASTVPRCLRCHRRQDELPPEDKSCANPGWHTAEVQVTAVAS